MEMIEEPTPDEHTPTRSVRSPRPRVLLADDDSWMRWVAAARLRRDGFEVYEVSSGAAVMHMLQRIREQRWPSDAIDVVIMDVRMPGPSGLHVAAELARSGARVPVVLMTAFPEPALCEEVARMGLPLLCKPFPLDRLTRAATDALRS